MTSERWKALTLTLNAIVTRASIEVLIALFGGNVFGGMTGAP